MKKFIIKVSTSFIVGLLLCFFNTEKSAPAHCKGSQVVLFDYLVKNRDFNRIISLTAHEMIHIHQLRRMGNEEFTCQYSEHRLGVRRIAIKRETDDLENHVRNSNIMNSSFMIVSDRNRNLYVKAINGAKHGSQIGLHKGCAMNKYNLDCRWLSLDGRIVSAADTTLSIKAHKVARHFAELRLNKNCNSDDLDCIWTWDSDGIIVSDKDRSFPVNAFNGARDGALLKLHQECRASNPDCTWRKEYFD